MGISPAQFEIMRIRLARAKAGRLDNPPQDEAIAAGEEGKLHDLIEKDLRSRRWLYVHSRMDKKSTNQPGVPDFLIFPPHWNVIFIECKSKAGKLTPEQQAFQLVAQLSGYQFEVVRSKAEYLKVIQPANSSKTA